jgi:MerR family redox-sensitive transcriptional activator SoxR
MAIGEVARRAGVPTSTLRYYESIGLLPEPGRVSGRRRYENGVFDRLDLIRVGRAAGLSLGDVGKLFNGFPDDASASQRWRTLAAERLPELEALIERASAMRDRLVALSACDCDNLDQCVHKLRRQPDSAPSGG